MDNLVFEKLYKEMGFSSQRRYPNEQLIQFLAKHYFSRSKGGRKKTKILEAGCGSGANLWMIAKEGFDTYGMDISPTSITLCKKMLKSYGAEADLRVGNIKSLGYKDSYFDAIVDILTIEHVDLEGHTKAYKEIYRCLKSGGRFFSWHFGSGSVSFTKGGGKRVDRYTVDDIPNKNVPYNNAGLTCFLPVAPAERMLTEAGFTDIHIEVITRTYKNRKQKAEYLSISAMKP